MTDKLPAELAKFSAFEALLRLEGGDAVHHEARAEHLAAVLSGLQKIAYLFAAKDAGAEVGARVKPSQSQRDRYAIRVGVPKAGSYALPLAQGAGHQAEILPDFGSDSLLDRIRDVFASIAANDLQALSRSLPGSLARKGLIEVSKWLPSQREGLAVSLQTAKHPVPVSLDWRANKFVKATLQGAAGTDAVMTVTGELQRIDFSSRLATLIYPPTRTEIQCSYLPEVEDTIIESRREPIQVTGRFVLDEDGNPKRLTDVTRIEPVDLSPIVVIGIDDPGVKWREPLELTPSLDEESQQYLCVNDPSIGLDAFAQTRDLLFDEIREQLAMLWTEYACADDADLDDSALALKHELLARATEH
jgi:hypothetical protein